MGWGGGWGDHVPETARIVAKAFYEGRTCRRGNCETDGETYWLEDHAIAYRIDTPKRVAYRLIHDGAETGVARPLQFSFAGWPTKMTARHLCALGVDASCYGTKNPSARFRNIQVDCGQWFTPAEIAALQPAPIVPKPVRAPRFVNMTMELFPA